MSSLYDKLINESHSLWTNGHLYDPFLAYFVFGEPFLPLAIAALWEIFEYLVYVSFGDYSFIFLNDRVQETMYDVLLQDIGGCLTGTLLAASICMIMYGTPLVPTDQSPWLRSTSIEQRIRIALLFFLRAVPTYPLSGFGWECNKIIDLCTSKGYHSFPWGVIPIWIINGVYTYVYFEGDKRRSTRNALLLGLIFISVPTLQREVPGSFIHTVYFGPASILLFLALFSRFLVQQYRSEAKKKTRKGTSSNKLSYVKLRM